MPEFKIPFEGFELNVFMESPLSPGDFPLLVLPGGPGFGYEFYLTSMKQFRDCAKLVFFDPPGCGKSLGFAPETLDLEQYIRAMEAVRMSLGVKRISLIGVSYGAIAAFEYLVRYQEHCAKTITIAGASSYRFLKLAKGNLAAKGTPEQIAICDKVLWSGGFSDKSAADEYFRLMTPLYCVNPPLGGTALYSTENFCAEACDNAWKTDFWRFDAEDRLPEVKTPLLCMWGASDWINDPSFGAIVKSKVPHAQVEIITDCGHSISRDRPDMLQALVRSFLAPSALEATYCKATAPANVLGMPSFGVFETNEFTL